MKLLVLVGLVGLAVAAPPPGPVEYYHDAVGIPAFNRMKAAESAIDFDGSRIVGGSAAVLGQFPHVAGLLIQLDLHRTSVCGASLISNTVLVTAAHCWFDGFNQASQLTVVLGTVFLFFGGTRIVSRNVVMHEQWNPSTTQNDVALIFLPSFVTFNNAINSINLPSDTDLHFDGVDAQAAGYGLQNDDGVIGSDQQMHHVTLRVISNVGCSFFFPPNSVTNNTICTLNFERPSRSPCGGDSGGPLQVHILGQRVLIGIISFDFRGSCDISSWPVLYARVTSFNTWIRDRM